MTAAHNDKPNVAFSLDDLEAEAAPPVTFSVQGKTFTARSPEDVDWQKLADLDTNDSRESIRTYLGADFDKFCELKLKQRTVNGLAERLNKHFGLLSEMPQGEGDA